MTQRDGEDGAREIIIVKRRNGDGDDGHHGGVWKIAFADFMTAMMCFFLVMWLINATSEETRIAVATYFNPMRLTDPVPSQNSADIPGQGRQENNNPDPTDTTNDNPQGERNSLSGPAPERKSSELSETREHSDRHLFADPYAVLAEIARRTATLQNVSAKGDGGAREAGPSQGATGGEFYRDPFAPDFWSQQVPDPVEEQTEPEPPAGAAPAEPPASAPAEAQEDLPEVEQRGELTGLPPTPEAAPEEPTETAEQSARELAAELSAIFGEDDALNRTVTVEAERDGVLISLTDDLDYGMFELGSAVPVGELVLAMEKVGAALDKREGKVVIRGHTDARPFRSDEYDNWRLSTARAHAASYMLIRGGLDEDRIAEIAGFAARDLKNPDDPFDGANRRIEILLQVAG